jgi:hypothetical protein
MIDVDTGGGDRLALAVLVQYRMATTEQLHPGDRPRGTHRADPAQAGRTAQ